MKDAIRNASQSGIKAAIDRGCVLPGVCFATTPVSVPQASVRPVGVPTAAPARRKFLRDWAKRNARRMAAGLSPILLVLPLAAAASAAAGPVDLSGIQGVTSYEVLENGDVQVTLDDGRVVTLQAASVQVGADGTVLVSEDMAQAIVEATNAPVDPGQADGGGANLAMLGPGGALALLAGAGGGAAAVAATVVKAFAVDGYLSGATIFGDANANGLLDTGEVQTTTAADGSFNQALFAADVPLVAVGGIDISTGKAFTGTLKAPAGSTVVTPLTTLVQTLLENGNGTQTAAQAADAVRASLGLASGVDLLNQDPVAAAEAGDLTQLQSAAKIAAIINLVSAAAPSDPGGAVDAVLKELTANISTTDLTNPAAVDAVLAKAGGLIEVASADLAKAIATATTQIDNTNTLGSLEGTQTVIQGTLTDAVTQSVGDTSGGSPLTTANTDTTYYDNAVGLRPVITSSTPTTDPINDAGGLQVSGTGQAGSTVTATIGLASASAQVDVNGNWSITFPSLGIKTAGTPDENIAVVVTAETGGVTSANATGAPVYLVDTQAPGAFTFTEITGQTGQYVNAAQITGAAITGTAEPGSVLSYTVNGGAAQSLVVGANGLVNIDISGNYIEGLNQFDYVLRDLAGNVATGNGNVTYYVDTIPPAAPTSSYGDVVSALPGPSTAYSGTGTGAPGDQIETLLLQNGQSPVLLGSTTVQSDGSWSFTSQLTGVAEGSYQIQAVAVDQAGNRTPGTSEPLLIDYTAPGAPVITSGTAVGAADVAGGNFVFAGTAEQNALIDVTVNGSPLPQTNADGSGAWSLSVQAMDGLYSVSVTATDAAGNVSAAATSTIEVDTVLPSIVNTTAPTAVNAAQAGAVQFSGTVSEAAQVTVTVLGANSAVVAQQSVATNASGAWLATLDLSTAMDGAYTVSVSADDGINPPTTNSTAATFNLDATPPALAVTAPAADVLLGLADVTGGAYTISGTAEADATVAVTINGTTTPVTATGGTWSLSRSAVEGVDSMSVVATDAAGNSSAAISRAVTYDATRPTNVSIDTFGAYVNAAASDIAFSGTAEDGTTLVVEIRPASGMPVALTVNGFTGGVWTASGLVPTEGSYTVAVIATDAAGNVTEVVSGAGFTVDVTPPPAPTGLTLSGAGADGIVNIAEATGANLTGTATANATVAYTTVAGGSGTVVADANGAFSIPLIGLLQTGGTTVSVREIDAAGNLSTPAQISVSADLTAPSVPTIDPVTGDNLVDGTEVQSSVNFTGTAEAGSTVTLSIDGAASGTATVTGSTWSIPVSITAPDGQHQVTVTSTDAAGNVTTSAPLDFIVATTSPNATIAPLAVGAVANAAEIAAAITVTGAYANASAVSVRVLSGTTEVVTPQTAVLTTGNWSVDLNLATLGDGAYTIEVTAVGNGLQSTSSAALAIDATVPAVPILDPVAGDGIVNAAESPTGTYNVTGTAEPASVVKVYDGAALLGQAAAATNGAFSISLAATDGAYNLNVTATDAAGNVSTGAPLAITVDTVLPTAPTFDVTSATYDATSVAAAVISGTGEAGSAVTLSSTLFGSDINVVVAPNGTWTTGTLDLSSSADTTYTISAIATDPAGNTSAAVDATRIVSAGAGVAITMIGSPPSGLVLESAVEFAKFADTNYIENAEGHVSGVAAGTTVSLAITGTDGTGTAFTLNYSGTTDGNGYFNIVVNKADIAAHDGMTSPGTITISAPGAAAYTLDMLINSAIADGTNTVFLAGHYAVSPLDYANTTLGLTGVATHQAETMSDGTLVVVMNTDTSSTALGYDIIATYNGTGTAPAEFFAFDGVNTADVSNPAAFLSQAFIRGDEVLVAQPNVTGTVDVTNGAINIQQSDGPLFTVYRIPLTSLAAALPTSGTVDNINTAAVGVTSFGIPLSAIDVTHATGSGIPANTVYQFLDLSNTTGNVLGLMTREDAGTNVVSDAYLVGFDLGPQSVTTSVKVDYTGLLFNGGELDPSKVYALLGTDALGAYTTATLPTPAQGDGFQHGVIYDYGTAQVTPAVRGNDGVQDLMIASGGNEVLDGGLGSVVTDNDLFVVGNAGGTATALKVTVAGGIVTVGVDTATLVNYLTAAGVTDNGGSPLPVSFDLFMAGSATLTNLAGTTYGSYTAAISTDTGTSSYGFNVARVTVDLDLQGIQALGNNAPATTELFSTATTGVDGTAFYGFGVNLATDPSITIAAPQFDGLQNVGGIDASGSQIVVLQNSGSRGGQDHIIGFDSSSGTGEDLVHVQADFGTFQGTALQSVASNGTLTLASNTGIVVFEGTNSIEDPAVKTMVTNAGISLTNQDLIVAVADGSATGLFTIGFNAAGAVSTSDFFGRIDGLTDLTAFGADNIQLFLPTV